MKKTKEWYQDKMAATQKELENADNWVLDVKRLAGRTGVSHPTAKGFVGLFIIKKEFKTKRIDVVDKDEKDE